MSNYKCFCFLISVVHMYSRENWVLGQRGRILSELLQRDVRSHLAPQQRPRFQRWSDSKGEKLFFFESKLWKATRNAKLKLQCIPVLLNGLNFANIWLLKLNIPCFCFLKENNLLFSLECSQSPADSECAVANNDSSLHGERSWNRTRRNVRNRKWSRKKEQDQRHDSYEKSKISCHVLWD